MNQETDRLYPNPMTTDSKVQPEILPLSTSVFTVSSPNAPRPIPLLLGPDNTVTVCPFCNNNIKTSVRYKSTTRTHILAVLCCFVCCCCCIPYCMDSAKNADHYCPSCKNYLGTYEK
ncbi:lipopolysaccharide-induced tumor necrosis factor-alpha factor homolog [Bicyclus anynana]|uniref:Lipopolysaccharide-induced tumor necrosis factor-alpha factor homolog n=1 Tax=Bicyclus anynana TaxID=110368 RepID=A0A6J1MGY6_BICAN|nr:lipopolysaccharide-induced tumor necrosis factor-alpha factor homolog [Bicyclus anynana]XP_052747381.1 lipopolysaccharide-induced tumor necrosis factor-alpha factor homolog [Bicyclus anynana]